MNNHILFFRNILITSLPKELGLLKKLISLDLEDVVINDPPAVAKVMRKSKSTVTSILGCLREQLLSYVPYRGVKLMLIGPKVSYDYQMHHFRQI